MAFDLKAPTFRHLEYEEYKDMKSTEIAAEVKRRIEETIKANGGWD